MFHRVAGRGLVLLGLIVGAFALSAWLHTDAMAHVYNEFSGTEALHGAVFKPGQWSSHWRLVNLVLLGIGCSIAASGVAVMLNKPWGYLLLFSSFVFAGTYPIIMRIAGYSQYRWEGGSLRGGLPYMAVALAALLGYVVMKRGQKSGIDRRPN